jgi:hypothetical protein
VSEENVEVVLALQEAIGEKDLVQLFRDDYLWGRFSQTVADRDSGCPLGSTQKVMLNSAFLFTLRDGKIVHCEGYPDRGEALKAVGLEE